MKKIFLIPILLITAFSPLSAKIRVVASYPYIEYLAGKIGGDRINVSSLAQGDWDPHYVVPRPSLISKIRQADLIIANGAELEVGWLPVLIRDSNNSRVQPGTEGYLELSEGANLIQKPETLSRALGDVHPQGNPHINMDPSMVPVLASMIAKRLTKLDPSGKDIYQKRLDDFKSHWNFKMKDWDSKMSRFSGTRVITYHRVFDYFLAHYGMTDPDTIEPLPGIPPSASHTEKVIEEIKNLKIKYILIDVYHERRPADFIAKRSGARVIVLPHDVKSIPEVNDLESMFDEIIRRLTND